MPIYAVKYFGGVYLYFLSVLFICVTLIYRQSFVYVFPNDLKCSPFSYF